MLSATDKMKKGKSLTKGQLLRMKKPDSCENLLIHKPSKKKRWIEQLDLKSKPIETSSSLLKKAYIDVDGGIELGLVPKLTDDGTSGTYILRG
jgi:hypothetical protein